MCCGGGSGLQKALLTRKRDMAGNLLGWCNGSVVVWHLGSKARTSAHAGHVVVGEVISGSMTRLNCASKSGLSPRAHGEGVLLRGVGHQTMGFSEGVR